MGRSTEQSYKTVVDYLKQRKLPATINDMVEANILSRGTVYKLFRPEMFAEMALYGLKPLNDNKPFFFSYDPELQLEILTKVNPEAGELVKEHKAVMTNAANKVAANAVILDPLQRSVLDAFNKFRDSYNKDTVLSDNFKQGPANVESYLEVINTLAETFTAEPIKFQSYILSAFVTMSKEL
jgi:hypothetical protein